MARRGYRVQDESVTAPQIPGAKYAGKSMTKRGEELRQKQAEAGMRDMTGQERGQRAAGKPTARYSSGVYPQDPIDSRMPVIQVS